MSQCQTKKGIDFEADCLKYMKIQHINSKEQLRQLTTCGSNKTFLKYFKNPDLMPLGMVEEILNALRVPDQERPQIIINLMGGRKWKKD